MKDIYFFTEHVPPYYREFSTVRVKRECLFSCHVVIVGNNVAFVFDFKCKCLLMLSSVMIN